MFVCLEPAAKYKLVLRQVLLYCANSLFGVVGAGSITGLLGSPRKSANHYLFIAWYCKVLYGMAL